ncbi:hypothetical protein ABPG77_007138 [Micractinium sp. CCAP 211/92]
MHLSEFDALLCKAAAAHAVGSQQHASGADSHCTVFLVSEVVNASGGRTGCFLYRGSLLTPAPRSSTPDCCVWKRAAVPGRAGIVEDQRVVPQQGSEELSWAELEGQELTLYLSYEEASPKMKRRVEAVGSPAAPWRAALRDAQDDLVFNLRGLPQSLQVDEEARLAVWGTQVAIAFPSAGDAREFADRLAAVTVERCSLAGTPQAALQAAQAAGRRLAGAPAARATARKAAAAPAPASQALSPASPDLMAALPRVGCKRPAATALPQTLVAPASKPRLAPTSSLATPTCAAELLA